MSNIYLSIFISIFLSLSIYLSISILYIYLSIFISIYLYISNLYIYLSRQLVTIWRPCSPLPLRMTGYLWVFSPTVPMELLSESCSPSRSPSRTEPGLLCRFDLTNLSHCAIKKNIFSKICRVKIDIGPDNCNLFLFLMLAEQKI